MPPYVKAESWLDHAIGEFANLNDDDLNDLPIWHLDSVETRMTIAYRRILQALPQEHGAGDQN